MKPSPKPETQNDENCAIILFNKSSVSPWQTKENTQVMVTNRKKSATGNYIDHFCKAIDVLIGDNVWEHNIVKEIDIIANYVPNVKIHYEKLIEDEIENPIFSALNENQKIDWNI
jgi:hypothetical protein